jgi:nucleoside 2-deoxyribosyltransferase
MQTKSVYLAARYARRKEGLRELGEQLQASGFEVTSQWLWDAEEKCRTIQEAAIMDVEDVRRADTLVFFGEPQASENRGGGRWFEFGMAHALGKRCIAVLNMNETKGGHDHLPVGHESVFTALPDVEIATSINELIELLGSQ